MRNLYLGHISLICRAILITLFLVGSLQRGDAKILLPKKHIAINHTPRKHGKTVVTALGIKRSNNALGYNVQRVENEELTRVKDVNFINAISGKVAGVAVNASSSGVGGASRVVMRGERLIGESSGVLYVIDGIPMFSYSKENTLDFSSSGSTDAVADINPEDIESLSVLTGAAAAAIYGINAANGAILINTKKGRAGRTRITLSQNTDFLNAFFLPKFQNKYGTGSSFTSENVVDKSWGHLLNESNYMGYSPKNDYLKTGVVSTETFTLSTGSKTNQTYLSLGAVNSAGIILNTKYDRYNITVRNTTSLLKDKMTLDLGANYIHQRDLNMLNQGISSNPITSAYLFPRGDDWNDIRMYERYNVSNNIYMQYWSKGESEFNGQNPYWINYRNLSENKKNRYMLYAKLDYRLLSWLSVSGRIRIDNADTDYDKKLYASTLATLTNSSNYGYYGASTVKDRQMYADVFVCVNKTFNKKYTLQTNMGISFSNVSQKLIDNEGPLQSFNDFRASSIDENSAHHLRSELQNKILSVFASAELGYRNAYYLTLTGRNDWMSHLVNPHTSRLSNFYPSVTASVILSKVFRLPEEINFLKIRGAFASVGSPFPSFMMTSSSEWDNTARQWKSKEIYPMENLKSQRTDSWEIGLTTQFLKHFSADITFYTADTYNLIFNPNLTVSSGYSALYVQSGRVRNQGIELSVGYHNKWNDFSWSSNYIFSSNRNKIVKLLRDYSHPETGVVINKISYDNGGLSNAHFIMKEGGSMGDLYTLSDLQRDSEGKVYIDSNGKVYTDTNAKEMKLGSVFPKCNMAWRNDFTWRNFNAGVVIAARLGGIVYSATQAALDAYGVSQTTADARDCGYVVVNGSDHVNPENWYSVIGANNGIPQYYTYSATNVRLQEAYLGYTFHRNKLWNIADLTISLVGRNICMIYCKAPFDPENVATTGNYNRGIDYFMIPNTRSVGFNIKLKF